MKLVMCLVTCIVCVYGAVAQEEESAGPDVETVFWLTNALADHGFTIEEAAGAAGVTVETAAAFAKKLAPGSTVSDCPAGTLKLLPYPGGRHPRIGFLDGAVNPHRGTKISVFAPWNSRSYVVVDLPEAVFSNLGLLYLAHTHVETIWEKQGVELPALEWTRKPGGILEHERTLPNGVRIGARAEPREDGVAMEMWLHNGTPAPLTGLRTQVCVLLRGAEGFNVQSNDNKVIGNPVVSVSAEGVGRHIVTAWTRCVRPWANPKCPCMHSDPQFPDCGPGETQRVRGYLLFHEGPDLDAARQKIVARLAE